MYNNPANYLNGTDPLNVTFPAQACILNIGGTENNCTAITGPAADSYLWYVCRLLFHSSSRSISTDMLLIIGLTNFIPLNRLIVSLRASW